MTPQVTPVSPTGPATPQSQMLAQVLQQMRTQPQTPAGGSANMMAAALNTFGQQAAGQGGANQWTGVNGKPSGSWFDSPLGSQVGSMFGLGKAAQTQQGLQAASQALGSGGVMPPAF